MLRDRRASVRRLSMAAVLAAGTIAPLVANGGAQAASGHAGAAAGSAAPVTNGPIVYSDEPHAGAQSKGTEVAVNPDGSGQHTLNDSQACGGPSDIYGKPGPVVFSPDGATAAFGCNGNALYLGTADLSRTTTIVPFQKNSVLAPVAWSVDGKTVYYKVQALGGGQQPPPVLWSVHADGTGRAPVTTIPAAYQLQSIAADGTMLLTSRQGVDGSVSVLTPGATTARLISDKSVGTPSLSTDGTKVAVIEDRGIDGYVFKVYNTDGSSSGGTIVAKVPADNTLGGIMLSPDGRQLAYTLWLRTPSAGTVGTQIWTVGTDGGAAPAKITESADLLGLTAWHSGPLPQTPRGVVQRLAGADRIGTAVAAADAAYNPHRAGTTRAKVAVISRSDSYADALAGNALAAQKHGPLLLTGNTSLDPAVAHELSTVLDSGSVVYVLGGPQALSPQIDAQIRALGLTPKRLAGPDRFATATAIAAEVSPHPHTVLVATGVNFPDALAAGAAAATDPDGGVVLLTDDTKVPAATRAYLDGVNPATTAVYGVGRQGVAALGTTALAGHFTPLAGDNRYTTDLAVANNTTLFPAPAAVGVATGENWPDALSGGAYIGALKGPLLLTEKAQDTMIPDAVAHADLWLMGHTLTIDQVAVFGGRAIFGDGIVRGFGAAAFGAGDFDVR